MENLYILLLLLLLLLYYYISYYIIIIITIIAETEIAIRDAESYKFQYDKCIELRDNERKATVTAIKELESKIHSLIEENNIKETNGREAMSNNVHYRNTIDSLRSQLEHTRMNHLQTLSSKDEEVTILQSNIRDLKKEMNERVRLQTKAERDLEDLKEKFKFEIVNVERRLGEENRVLRQVIMNE